MSSLDHILTGLSNLSPEDLQKVRLVAGHLGGSNADGPGDIPDAVKEVWPLFADQLAFRGVKSPPLTIVSRHRNYPDLVEGCEHVVGFLKRFKPRNSLERLEALRICVEATLRRLDRIGLPCTVRVLAQQLPNVGLAVDEQFPHYRDAGLLPVLLRGLNGKPVK